MDVAFCSAEPHGPVRSQLAAPPYFGRFGMISARHPTTNRQRQRLSQPSGVGAHCYEEGPSRGAGNFLELCRHTGRRSATACGSASAVVHC
jgi:hypothetical protein